MTDYDYRAMLITQFSVFLSVMIIIENNANQRNGDRA